MTTVTKMSSRGQVTVPTEVRDALGIQPDDLLVWDINADGLAVVSRLASTEIDQTLPGFKLQADWPLDHDV